MVARHDEQGIAPGGDVIKAFLPDGPALILMDELLNYISRERQRKSGQSDQLYHFLQNLSEEAHGCSNVVLCVSIPASELEMTPEDHRDYEAIKKLLDRLGKAVIMSTETEIAEIIRRRLFDWGGLPDDAKITASSYAKWVIEHKQMVGDFDVDSAHDRFLASYPFHPALLSVFERKWQSLPRFQKTRGVLRLLALWVSQAYSQGFKGAHADPLIGLGTAPIEDPYFRAAMFEQLGNNDLEGPVTTDIAGKKEAHAIRLNREAASEIKKKRLHQKMATVVLFESNGGTTRAEATLPEIRLAVAEPDLDIANVETVLDGLNASCYYLKSVNNRYWFSLTPNLNKLLTDRRATIKKPAIDERVKQVVQEVFKAGPSLDRVYFPDKTGQVPDRPALMLAIMAPDQLHGDSATTKLMDQIVREYGQSGRTFIFDPSSGVDESDIEISDEFVLLRAKDAIDRTEPRRLTRIELTPPSASIKPGDSIKFSAIGYDQHGSPFGDTNVTWSATGGTIDQEGRFSAEVIGNFRVEAWSDSFVGTATISVQTAPPPPPPPGKGCAWQGTVPPQKWMNFYTKVLSPLVSTTPGLKLQVQFEVPPGDPTIDAKVDAAKAALRNLGLQEDVQMR